VAPARQVVTGAAQAGFDPVAAVAAVMRGYPHPWFIAGGWAIDLFVGRVTRAHEDVEVGAFLPHQDALRRQLAGWKLFRSHDDRWEPWPPDVRIELPEFQAKARREQGDPRQFDVFFNPLDGDDWVSRRHDGLRVPIEKVSGRTPDAGALPNIPYFAPELQLLYKAKHHRPRDEADFAVALPRLGRRRRWLREALERFQPGDPWIPRLS
jgi:hypothetical protein